MTTRAKQSSKGGGLAGVIAGESAICSPQQKALIYRGYEIADLAEHATFEDVAFLLYFSHKPDATERRRFATRLTEAALLPEGSRELAQRIAADAPVFNFMDTLRTIVAFTSHFDPQSQDNSAAAEQSKATRLLAQIPLMIGRIQAARMKREPLDWDASLGLAGNLLRQILGRAPGERETRLMDVSLILYAEHDFNASTFSSRVIAATLSDMHSAVTGAIAALKGPLHGGANEAALEVILEIGSVENVEPFLERAFAEKRKIMGFGHRVYQNGDHRAEIIHSKSRAYAKTEKPQLIKWFEVGERMHKLMLEKKNIHPNLDWYSALAYYALEIPVELFTPIFVASRLTGWCAHIMEQHANNRLIRPLSRYTGPKPRRWNAT